MFVNIRLNDNKSWTSKLEDHFWILEDINIYKVKGKKGFNQMAAKATHDALKKLLLEFLVPFLEPD